MVCKREKIVEGEVWEKWESRQYSMAFWPHKEFDSYAEWNEDPLHDSEEKNKTQKHDMI